MIKILKNYMPRLMNSLVDRIISSPNGMSIKTNKITKSN